MGYGNGNLALGQNPINGVPIRAMLVDDTKVIRLVLKQILLTEKFNVIMEAENGQEAIQMIKNALEKPEVLFIDKEMPIMDGITTIRELHPLFPNIKIIMVTSINDEDTIKEAIQLGITGYIIKPSPNKTFDRTEFLERIAKFLGREDYGSKYLTSI